MNIRLTGEHSLGASEPKLPQPHFVKGAEDLNASSQGASASHIGHYVIYLQLSSKVEEEVTSSSTSATSHVIHNFEEHRLRVCFSLSAGFQLTKSSKKKKEESEQKDSERAYLLTEDQLVIKEEEDSLLATSIRLIDP